MIPIWHTKTNILVYHSYETKRYGVNVREAALQPREKQWNLQSLKSPQSLQQGCNITPCEKLYITPNKKYRMSKIILLLNEYYQKP